MATGILVKDAMRSRVVTIRPDQTVVEAAHEMRKERIGLLVVCDGKKPIGVITREDIVTKVVAKNKNPSKIFVSKIMNMPVVFVEPEIDLAEAARKMVEHGYERLPVISLGKIVGLLSDRDIARVAPAAIEILLERLKMKDETVKEEGAQAGECEICGNFDETLYNIEDQWICATCRDEQE